MKQAGDKHVVVVGAGPGGLTCAMILAHRGFRVTVYEKQAEVGGRNASLKLGPYVFDTGPTFLMLKSVLDEVFQEAGTSTGEQLETVPLDPMYRLEFDDRALAVSSDHAVMREEIARVFPGMEEGFDRFLVREKRRFAHMFPCLQKSYHRLRTLLHPDLLRALPDLEIGRSLYSVMRRYFATEKLGLSFTFQSKYLGMSPWECPGFFAMIPYIEHAFGIYHTQGGLSRISEQMAAVAKQSGAEIHTGCAVRQVLVNAQRCATGVLLEDGERVDADAVVLGADFGYAACHLFEPGLLRKYAPERLAKKKWSCSTLMLFLGLDTLYDDAPHHHILFARDYRANVDAIFQNKLPSPDLSFYVRNASVTDPTLAPKGHSAVYVLVPMPNNRSGETWEPQQIAEIRQTVLALIEQRTPMHDLRSHICEEQVISPLDWQHQYNVYQGATFNLAHNLGQMIYWRPRNRFEEVGNCYLVGGGTHPGSGLPTIYESGRISANLISRAHGVEFVSGNLAV